MSEYDIRGTKYLIKESRIKDLGQCDSPSKPKPTIRINRKLKGFKRLEVLIHEILHACHWDLDEEAIDETAQVLATILSDYFTIEEKE